MNAIDTLLLLAVVGAVWLGYHQGILRQLWGSIGAVMGLFISSFVYNKFYFLAANSGPRTILFALVLVAMVCVCVDVALTFGKRFEHHRSHTKKERRTVPYILRHACSAAIAGGSAVVVLWVIVGLVNVLPIPFLQNQIRSSQLVGVVRQNIPLPGMFIETANLLSPFSAPQTFVGAEPSFTAAITTSQSFSALDDAVAKTSPSVFKLYSWGCNATSEGTGFAISSQAIVTNAHVVSGATRISVSGGDGSVSYAGRVIFFDPRLDIAVVATSLPLSTTPLSFYKDTVRPGTIGAVIGYPQGQGRTDTDAIVLQNLNAEGLDIYGKSQVVRNIYAIRSNVVPGNSGGPLIAANGQVIGVVFGHSTAQRRTGYAIAAEQFSDAITAALQRNAAVSNGSCGS